MMLKTKLHKAGFIITSFMLMAAASGNNTQPSGDSSVVCTDAIISKHDVHEFDSTGLCICLPQLSEEELGAAPRIQLNAQAASFASKYIKDGGLFMGKIKTKSSHYFDMIDSVFTKYDIPVEMKYLAVVESRLDNRIISTAGATGLWQFMASPARTFGLKVNGKVDERKNNYKSTVAAAKCIRYLHDMFGDWLLTLAAYNSGPARVKSAMKKSGSRDFWVLQKYLPLETRRHVLKFISTHYFFEGHGSMVTMTKAETEAHINAVEAFVQLQKPVNTEESIQTEVTDAVSNL